ncbi:hypothetical protein [Poseidonibacter ostreae]|jgi:magnesium-transporting ATPase (P-type)|uniref:Uncharacterized protein n=1 Tax=Poseidonibacter ostreae TaxID=2654171 RepID=A0A6L4WNN6_9BACT|nr:hypothetical protein [Poseidonibacter ostreae]KAB7883149.1 hypothetical protein GA417_12815 [Poseidonibacter ostreae]KAB7885152.1 hypothetical protein GBG19_14730 [Poseidonibacter ostreae]KAB7887628.1 hypothetical protein GBG18_13855 [Poseidonibacter ostreae]
MFKQVKSALFWYYLIKFRRRIILIVLLLIIALFANAIYSDVVEYLTLKEKLEFLEIVLLSKWFIIIFNIVFSIYLLLTMFKNEEEKEVLKKKEKKNPIDETIKPESSNEKFSHREKQFLYKKKLKNQADILVDK